MEHGLRKFRNEAITRRNLFSGIDLGFRIWPTLSCNQDCTPRQSAPGHRNRSSAAALENKGKSSSGCLKGFLNPVNLRVNTTKCAERFNKAFLMPDLLANRQTGKQKLKSLIEIPHSLVREAHIVIRVPKSKFRV